MLKRVWRRSPPILRRREFWLTLALILGVVSLSAPFWVAPMQRDQGVYAACGNILLKGGAPYRDCWDTKAPLTHYTYALAQGLFGRRLAGSVALNALWAALTGVGLWRLGREWWGDRLGWLVGLVYGWQIVSIPFDMNVQPEGFANLLIVWAAWGLLFGRKRSHWVLAGAFLAGAALYKYTLLLVAGVVACLALWSRPHAESRRKVLLVSLSSSIAVLALFALYLWARGALAYAVEHVVFMLTEFPKAQINPTLWLFPGESLPPWLYWQRTWRQLTNWPILYPMGLIACLTAIRQRRAWAWLTAGWLVVAAASVYLQKVMTLYHWTLAIPPLALAFGGLTWELRARRVWAALCIAAVLANVGYRVYADQWLLVQDYWLGKQTRTELYASQAIGDELEVADYIRPRTRPTDRIWVWGNHSIIYYWADRPSPTRFIFNSPLMARLGDNAFQPRWKAEVLADLYARPPVYIVMTWYDRTWFDYENPVDEFAKIPGYQEFLDTYYRPETFLGRFRLHRLTPWWSRYSPALAQVTAIDLLANLDSAELRPSPTDPIQTDSFQLNDEPAYPTLFMHAEGSATFHLTLPDAVPCFRADAALDPVSWGWGGDGADFRVFINGVQMVEQYVANTPAERFWRPLLLDLSAWAGQPITLTLATGPGPHVDFTGDRAGWGLPRIVQAPGPTCDTDAIVR